MSANRCLQNGDLSHLESNIAPMASTSTFAPILISFCFRLCVSDQSLIGSGRRQLVRQEVAEIIGEGMKLKPHRVRGE